MSDEPVAYWRLDDLTGTTAVDSSGNGYAGAYSGDYTLGQSPLTRTGASVLFGGGTGLMQADPPNPTAAITVQCWLRTSTTQTDAGLVGRWDTATSWVLHVTATEIQFSILPSSMVEVSATYAFAIADGNVHHVAATYDSGSGAVSLYLDGALVGSATASGTLTASTQNVTVANYALAVGGPGNFFTGELQEAAVYPTALSADRILAHYNAGTDPWAWAEQDRIELFTRNLRGQTTTAVDAEGNLTVFLRYPENDPDGDGQIVSPSLTAKQYGLLKETRVDADPNLVMSLVGPDGDLVDFVPNIITRTNTPGVYQDLVTRNGGGAHGCPVCSYDPLGNVLSETDARGFTRIFDRNEMGEIYRVTSPAPYNCRVETYYDANGNVVRVDTEDQQVAYQSGDPTDAFYARFTPSGNGIAGLGVAQVPTLPGPGGSVRPGWFSNLYTFDILDNKTSQDIDATGSNPASLVTTYTRDANENVVKITKPDKNIVEFDYDERNLRIAQRVGYISPTQPGAVTVWAFDPNGNLLDMVGPTDRTGNPGTVLTATIADAFRSEVPLVHTGDWSVQNIYDGFNRVTQAVDAIGNFVLSTYDPGGRAVAMAQQGLIGGPSPTDNSGTGNVTLASAESRFDEAGRMYESQMDVFLATGTTLPSTRAVTHTGGGWAANSTTNSNTGTVTLTTGGSSYVLTRSVYDRADRLVQQAADNTAATLITLDGAGRVIATQDALGNQVINTLDGNGNVILATRIDKCTISDSIATESFSTAFAFDCLNRLVARMDQAPDGSLSTNWTLGATWPVLPPTLFTFIGFDSRNNATLTIDPKGNTTVAVFDGASRQTQTLVQMRLGGSGPNPPAGNTSFLESGRGVIRTDIVLDGNGRVTQLIDDRGGNTWFGYDSLDRQVTLTFHDQSVRTNTFNAAGDIVTYVDENGSVFANTFDAAGRRTAVAITLATGVVGTTAQSFQYDGLLRVTDSQDNSGITVADLCYDSLGRVLEESQFFTSHLTYYAWTSYAATGFTFPDGRQIALGFDPLYRKDAINEVSDSSSIAAWQFFGGRIATVALGNGLVCSFMNNAQTRSAIQQGQPIPAWGDITTDHLGFDGSGRVTAKRYFNGTSVLVGFTTQYDPAGNKLYERHLHAESRSHLYPGYDSPDRLLQYQRGILATGGASVTTPITLPNTDSQRTYNLDGLGNWNNTAYTPVGGAPTTEYRRHNYLNQITRFGATAVLYDHGNNAASPDPNVQARGNGNIVNDGTRTYLFDALNRLIQVNRTSDGLVIATYMYDALNRRVTKTVSNGGLTGTLPNGTWNYLYSGARIVHETDPAGAATQYVWGQYIDELIQMKTNDVTGPQSLPAGSYYLLSDLLYRSVALTDSTGAIREAYDTDAYGKTLLFSGPGTDGLWFTGDSRRKAGQVRFPASDTGKHWASRS